MRHETFPSNALATLRFRMSHTLKCSESTEPKNVYGRYFLTIQSSPFCLLMFNLTLLHAKRKFEFGPPNEY